MKNLSWYKTTKEKLDSLPQISGLYILSVLLRNQEYGVFYVGQAKNLKQRVRQHFNECESNDELREFLNRNYSFKISYASCELDYLDAVERFLIRYYKPRFNNQDGNGETNTSCNLPNVVVWNNRV